MECEWPPCRSERIYRDGYCYDHWRHTGGKEVPKKKEPIKKISDKRKPLEREYKKLVKAMLDEDNRCEVKSPVCTGIAQGLNHKEKRSDRNLTDPDNLERSCNACNQYVELNKEWALKNGHLKLKHKIY